MLLRPSLCYMATHLRQQVVILWFLIVEGGEKAIARSTILWACTLLRVCKPILGHLNNMGFLMEMWKLFQTGRNFSASTCATQLWTCSTASWMPQSLEETLAHVLHTDVPASPHTCPTTHCPLHLYLLYLGSTVNFLRYIIPWYSAVRVRQIKLALGANNVLIELKRCMG